MSSPATAWQLSDLPGILRRMNSSTTDRWPAPVVIGLTSAGDLTFLVEDHAVGAADELDRWRAATTWGEARTLAAQATFLVPPFVVEDLGEDEDGGASFAVADLGVVHDGDWPPAAQTSSLELVQRHWSGSRPFEVGAVADTMLNGPVLLLRPDDEDALRQVLEAAGCSVRRDDDLVRRAGEA